MKDSHLYRGKHWDLMQENDWNLGDILESVGIEPDGTRLKIRIVRMTTWENITLDLNCKPDDPGAAYHGQFAGHKSIITFCEWPLGGGHNRYFSHL